MISATVAGKFFERLDRLRVLAHVLWPGRHVRKPELVQHARDVALMIPHAKALEDHLLQIDPSPADDAIRVRIRASSDNRGQLLPLVGRELARRAGRLTVDQPVRAFGVEAVDPVAQRLTVHAAQFRGLAPATPLGDASESEKTRALTVSGRSRPPTV
jgi:hypothetical protein